MIIAMLIITIVSLIMYVYFAYANRLNEKLKNHQESKFVSTKPSPYRGKLRLTKQFSLICVLMLSISSISLIDNKKVYTLDNRNEYLEMMSMPSNTQTIEKVDFVEYATRAIEFNEAIYLSKNDGLVKVDKELTEVSLKMATNDTLFVMDNKIISHSRMNNYQAITVYNPDTLVKEHIFEVVNASIIEATLENNLLNVYLVVKGIGLEELDLIYNAKDISLNYKDISYLENVNSNQMFAHVQINIKTNSAKAKAIMLPEFHINNNGKFTYINFNSRIDSFGFSRCMVVKYNNKTMSIKDYEEFGGTTAEKVTIVSGKIKLIVGATLSEENRYTVYTLNDRLEILKEDKLSLSSNEVLVINQTNALSQSVAVDKVDSNAILKMFVENELVAINKNQNNLNIHLLNSNKTLEITELELSPHVKIIEANVYNSKLQALLDNHQTLIYLEVDVLGQSLYFEEFEKETTSEIYLTNNYFVVVEKNTYHIYNVNERN